MWNVVRTVYTAVLS